MQIRDWRFIHAEITGLEIFFPPQAREQTPLSQRIGIFRPTAKPADEPKGKAAATDAGPGQGALGKGQTVS